MIGASNAHQLTGNLAALDFDLSADQIAALDRASAPPAENPYPIFEPALNRVIFGGATVRR